MTLEGELSISLKSTASQALSQVLDLLQPNDVDAYRIKQGLTGDEYTIQSLRKILNSYEFRHEFKVSWSHQSNTPEIITKSEDALRETIAQSLSALGLHQSTWARRSPNARLVVPDVNIFNKQAKFLDGYFSAVIGRKKI